MKKLMLSTAVLAALGGVAMAQNATVPGMFRTEADPMSLRASDFIGMRIYASEVSIDADEYDGMQQDWEDIGEVNDVILSRDGVVDAVLVDIGGFLGMGERQVAVGMEAIRFVSDGSTADRMDDFFIVMSAARADFEAAPDYLAGDMTDTTDAAMTDEVATDTMRDPMLRDGYVVAEAEYLTSDKLTGASVYDANDEEIGNVGTLILSPEGQVTHAIIDVGGFLGMGEKPVALDLADIDILRNEAGDDVRVYVAMTREQLETLPAFDG